MLLYVDHLVDIYDWQKDLRELGKQGVVEMREEEIIHHVVHNFSNLQLYNATYSGNEN